MLAIGCDSDESRMTVTFLDKVGVSVEFTARRKGRKIKWLVPDV